MLSSIKSQIVCKLDENFLPKIKNIRFWDQLGKKTSKQPDNNSKAVIAFKTNFACP